MRGHPGGWHGRAELRRSRQRHHHQTVGEYLAAPEDDLNREELAKEAIRAANQKVLDAARVRTECDGMGSTIVMALWDAADW